MPLQEYLTLKNGSSIKNARRRLSARYLTVLGTYLGDKSRSNGGRAQSLGRAAVAGRLTTLDLAVMQEKAVVALSASHDFASAYNSSLKRAGLFFTQALIALEAAQRMVRQSHHDLQERNERLRLLTTALARGNPGWNVKSCAARRASYSKSLAERKKIKNPDDSLRGSRGLGRRQANRRPDWHEGRGRDGRRKADHRICAAKARPCAPKFPSTRRRK